MKTRNKWFFALLICGIIALLIGANHKVNGNEHADIPLVAGMLMELTAITGLLLYNFSSLKKLFR